MIQIHRTESTPDILKRNQEKWTQDLLDLIASTPEGYQKISKKDKRDKIRDKYQREEIKDKLETISHKLETFFL